MDWIKDFLDSAVQRSETDSNRVSELEHAASHNKDLAKDTHKDP